MEAAKQPNSDVLASNLLFGYLAFIYAWAALDKYVLHRVSLLDVEPKGIAITIIACAVTYYFIRKGKLLAKLLFILLFAWQIIGPVLDYKRLLPHLAHDPVGIANYAISYAVQGWALVLIFGRKPVQAA